MKHFFLFLFSAFCALLPVSSFAIMRTVSKPEAYYRIQNQIPSTADVYYYMSSTAHIFFVDEEPQKGWSHNCKYYWVPTQIDINNIPTATIESAQMPKYDYAFEPHVIRSCQTQPTINVKNAIMTEGQLNAVGKTYAVIISGGYTTASNYQRYWNDCSFIYQTLRRRFHIEKDHISVLISDGTNPSADMVGPGGHYISSPLDLDNDGVADIGLAATRANVISELNRLSQVMTSDDKLFLYVIDHGGTDDHLSSSYICLWNKTRLYDYELASILNNYNVSSMSIVLGQCFSGGFIDNLSAPNRSIVTACLGSESSFARADGIFDEFVYHWTSAVNERDAYGTPVESDIDDNGKVTIQESFNYAQIHDIQSETPQISTSPIRYLLALNDEPFTHILMIKDNPEDIGDEPNTTTDLTYICEDVWMRNQNDGEVNQEHQVITVTGDDPKFYAFYRIYNIGEKDYNGSGMFLHAYWADGSLGLTRAIWAGENTEGIYVNGSPLPVKNIRITIPAGESRILGCKYDVPDGIIERVYDNQTDQFHICYLVNLSPSQSLSLPIPPNPEYPVVADILGKRSLVQKNAAFIAGEESSIIEIPLNVNNVCIDDHEYDIEILPVKEYPTNDAKIEVGIRMSDNIYSAWNKKGAFAEKVISYKSAPKKVYVQEFNSKIQNIELKKNEIGKIFCTCEIIAKEDITEETLYAYDIVLRDKVSGTIIDGERIVIKQQPRKAILPEIKQEIIDGGYLLKAINVDEPATYTWYNEAGENIAEGKEIKVGPNVNEKQLRVKVKAGSDGAVNYAYTTVGSNLSIESVTPNPFNTQITIVLNEPATENTILKLTPASNAGLAEFYQVKAGEKEMTIFTSKYKKGIYVLSLLKENNLIETRQLIHH